MKITVHADDGYVADVVFSKTSTSRNVVENFCKKRHTDGGAVNTQELQLAYESEPNAELELFPQDSIVQDHLKVHENYKKGRLVLVGYNVTTGSNGSQSNAVSVPSTKIAKTNVTASKVNNGNVADQIRKKTEGFFVEVHKLLDGELNRGNPNKEQLLAAKRKHVSVFTDLVCWLLLSRDLLYSFAHRGAAGG
jgi:hypothetical protein